MKRILVLALAALVVSFGAVARTDIFDSVIIGGSLTMSGTSATSFVGATFAVDMSSTVVIDGATSVRGISAGFTSIEGPALRIGPNANFYMNVAVATTTGATAITHVGSGATTPAVTWTMGSLSLTGNFATDGATNVLDGSTSVRGISAGFVSLESPANRLGANAAEYMQVATTASTGATAITHTGSGPAVTWTANSLAFTGNFSSDGATAVLDGSTSVRNISAGFVSSESPANRFGANATEYIQIATTGSTGITAITHTGSAPAVTWTNTHGITFVGAVTVHGGTFSVGTDAVAGTLELYPSTTAQGTTTFTMSDNTGDTITNINVAAQAGARTYTVPDVGSVTGTFILADDAGDVAVANDLSVAGTLTTGSGITWTSPLVIGGSAPAPVDGHFSVVTSADADVFVADASGPLVTITSDTNIVGDLDITGDLEADGGTVALDGSTSVRGISAGFTSLESPANRFGVNDAVYMQVATTAVSGITAITHTGTGPTVTWTADSFDFVGAMAADALTLSDVLTFSDGGTIDNTAVDTLTITEDNIVLTGDTSVTSTNTLSIGGNPVVLNHRHRVTVAEINAGHELLPAIAGRSYRIINVTAIAYGDAVATTTTVDVLGTQSAGSVQLVTFAQGDLVRSAVLTIEADGTVLADGATFVACDVNTAITVGKTGSDADGATGVDFIITYVIE